MWDIFKKKDLPHLQATSGRSKRKSYLRKPEPLPRPNQRSNQETTHSCQKCSDNANRLKKELNDLFTKIEDPENYYGYFYFTYADSVKVEFLIEELGHRGTITIEEMGELYERKRKAQRSMVQAQLNWMTEEWDRRIEDFSKLTPRNAVSSVLCCVFDSGLVLKERDFDGE